MRKSSPEVRALRWAIWVVTVCVGFAGVYSIADPEYNMGAALMFLAICGVFTILALQPED